MNERYWIWLVILVFYGGFRMLRFFLRGDPGMARMNAAARQILKTRGQPAQTQPVPTQPSHPGKPQPRGHIHHIPRVRLSKDQQKQRTAEAMTRPSTVVVRPRSLRIAPNTPVVER